jgi:hypothetical protein
MTKKVAFKYFLNGKKVDKLDIDWDSDITVKTIEDQVYVTTTTEGYLSTRHKHPPGGYNKED